ncbi:MAG: glycosyltransferase [Desulfobacterales bacterium]
MFSNTYLPHVGGVARSVSICSKDLGKMGNDVMVIVPEYSDSESWRGDGPEILRVPAIQNFNGSDFSVRIPVPFIIDDAIDKFKPDVIHSHHPYLLGDAALRAARRRSLPLVFTHHTLYEEYTHYVSNNPKTMKHFAIHLSTEYANMCTRVIAPSKSIAHLIKERGVIPPVEEIPTGVDIRFFSEGHREKFREEFRIPQDAFVIGHLGRLAPEKNLKFLAQAISDSMKDLPNSRFLVVGKGPGAEEIIQIFNKRGFNDRLIMAGKQTGTRLCDAYHAMDLFVFASKSETQGMVLTEAMAAGIPVIAIDAPGAREVVSNSKNGILLPWNASEHMFSKAVRDAILDPEKIFRWRKVALKTALKFDRKKCAEKLYDLYQAVITDSESYAENAMGHLKKWENLLGTIRTEWDLASEKARAVIKTVSKNKKTVHLGE